LEYGGGKATGSFKKIVMDYALFIYQEREGKSARQRTEKG
jgi:hypothetical protein